MKGPREALGEPTLREVGDDLRGVTRVAARGGQDAADPVLKCPSRDQEGMCPLRCGAPPSRGASSHAAECGSITIDFRASHLWVALAREPATGSRQPLARGAVPRTGGRGGEW